MNSFDDILSFFLAPIIISVIAVLTRGDGEKNLTKIAILSSTLIIVSIVLQLFY